MSYPKKCTNTAVIAVGANLGEKVENSRKGIAALDASGKLEVIRQSGFYLTEPVGYAEQSWFINSVLIARTRLSPFELLGFLKKMERRFGRVDCGIRYGPRVLDFDIIFYNDWVIESRALTVPHPRMQERGFVMNPLCDIAPDWIHPVFQQTVQQLLNKMGAQHEACIPMEALYN
ncbi:MAG: 2-amino-4-hydroxy-6-hydroxymethyldihydropteridine diphosphokinase [Desulfobacterales bacterium]|nr:2-amino-4-hydroxy-6-hydroxymethyldihydropteridine diphosphokinase [Desulfobacterales bacterium]